MTILDPRLGEIAEETNRASNIGHFRHWLSFSELVANFYALPSYKYFCFVPTSFLDGNHQGASISHETTHYECLQLHKFISMWYIPNMVTHVMPILAHEFINFDQDPSPINVLYFSYFINICSSLYIGVWYE
jgi:hypothetical protein